MAKLLELGFEDGNDTSGNSRNITPSGNTVYTAAGGGYTYGGALPNSKGLTQSAIVVYTSHAAAGSWLNNASRTWSAWVKVNSTPGSNWWAGEHYQTTNDTGVFGLLYLSSVLRFRAKNTSNAATDITLVADVGNWHFIAATFDDATKKLRVYRSDNTGTLVEMTTGGGTTIATGIFSANDLRLLDEPGTAATLDSFRLHDVALTQAELTTLMGEQPGGASAASGTLNMSTNSPSASLTASSRASGVLAGQTGTPTVAAAGTATSTGALSASIASPSFAGSGVSQIAAALAGVLPSPSASFSLAAVSDGELRSSLGSPSFAAAGVGGVAAALAGSFANPTLSLAVGSAASAALAGSFARPILVLSGGQPIPEVDIDVTVQPLYADRVNVQLAPSRLEIGVLMADSRWELGNKEMIPFRLTFKGQTAAEIDAYDIRMAVTTTPEEPEQWVDASIADIVEVNGNVSCVAKLLYEAVVPGLKYVWLEVDAGFERLVRRPMTIFVR